VFEDVGVVAGVVGVTVVHGGSWKAAEFNKTADLAQTARATARPDARTTGKKSPG
jgi:hypothetical protein